MNKHVKLRPAELIGHAPVDHLVSLLLAAKAEERRLDETHSPTIYHLPETDERRQVVQNKFTANCDHVEMLESALLSGPACNVSSALAQLMVIFARLDYVETLGRNSKDPSPDVAVERLRRGLASVIHFFAEQQNIDLTHIGEGFYLPDYLDPYAPEPELPAPPTEAQAA